MPNLYAKSRFNRLISFGSSISAYSVICHLGISCERREKLFAIYFASFPSPWYSQQIVSIALIVQPRKDATRSLMPIMVGADGIVV